MAGTSDPGTSSRYLQSGPISDNEIEKRSPETTTTTASEVTGRRSRGRPRGSKNKPKPPIIITRDSGNAMRSHVLEVASGEDIAEALSSYTRRGRRGICVLSAAGSVANVVLRQPGAASAAGAVQVATLRGRFEILSLCGSVLPPPTPPGLSGLAVFLAGGQGQVVGGIVAGPLIAAGPVILMAASFTNVAYERLPIHEGEEEGNGTQAVAVSRSPEVAVAGIANVARSSFFNLPAAMVNGQFPPEAFPCGDGAARPPY